MHPKDLYVNIVVHPLLIPGIPASTSRGKLETDTLASIKQDFKEGAAFLSAIELVPGEGKIVHVSTLGVGGTKQPWYSFLIPDDVLDKLSHDPIVYLEIF